MSKKHKGMKKNCTAMSRNCDNINGLELLSNAIIMQAVKDYKSNYKLLRKNPKNDRARHELQSLERFFLGGWIKALSDLDGKAILLHMKEILRDEGKSDK